MMYTNKCTVALPTKDTTSVGTFADVVVKEVVFLSEVVNMYFGKVHILEIKYYYYIYIQR